MIPSMTHPSQHQDARASEPHSTGSAGCMCVCLPLSFERSFPRSGQASRSLQRFWCITQRDSTQLRALSGSRSHILVLQQHHRSSARPWGWWDHGSVTQRWGPSHCWRCKSSGVCSSFTCSTSTLPRDAIGDTVETGPMCHVPTLIAGPGPSHKPLTPSGTLKAPQALLVRVEGAWLCSPSPPACRHQEMAHWDPPSCAASAQRCGHSVWDRQRTVAPRGGPGAGWSWPGEEAQCISQTHAASRAAVEVQPRPKAAFRSWERAAPVLPPQHPAAAASPDTEGRSLKPRGLRCCRRRTEGIRNHHAAPTEPVCDRTYPGLNPWE